jgi:hypothetical protein
MDKCALCGHDKSDHYFPVGCHHKDGDKICGCVWGSILERRFRVIDDWVYQPVLLHREDHMLFSVTS